MTLTPAMEAALGQGAVTMFFAWRIDLPYGSAALLDGSGVATFGGLTFTGADGLVGALKSAELDGDGLALEAPTLRLVVQPPTDEASAALCAQSVQGSLIRMWEGVIDPASGLVIPDPDLKFIGEIDVPTLRLTRGVREVTLEAVSIWDRLFDQEEGARLTDGFHQGICPGELAFEFVGLVTDGPVWGSSAPRPSTTTVLSTGATGVFRAGDLAREI